jgi:hypothetical protein
MREHEPIAIPELLTKLFVPKLQKPNTDYANTWHKEIIRDGAYYVLYDWEGVAYHANASEVERIRKLAGILLTMHGFVHKA